MGKNSWEAHGHLFPFPADYSRHILDILYSYFASQRKNQPELQAIGWIDLCTPGMGVNLWGESPLYENQEVFIIDGYYQKYEPKARAGGRPTV